MYGCGSAIAKSPKVTANTLHQGNIDPMVAKSLRRMINEMSHPTNGNTCSNGKAPKRNIPPAVLRNAIRTY